MKIAPHGIEAPSFAALFTPKFVTVLKEGYGLAGLRADALAGLTVAIVALPLSMAFAIASGAAPERGLYTAIVGGFLVSALGGSRFQIGGPAGAFIVLVASTVTRHGIEGVFLATMMAGLFLMLIGFLRLGAYIKYIPFPVTVGFTAGIAIIIFASQLKDLFGLTLAGKEPADFLPKMAALSGAIGTVNAAALGLALSSIAVIVVLKRLLPHWPGMVLAIALAAVAAWGFHLPVETIGTRFGGIPSTLPAPSLPPVSPWLIVALLPDAFAFALLGAIESLLSAVVADGMTGRRHRSNCELVAQGVANIASGLFGGICVTGTIARTATNVRAGARGPVSGMLHAVFLLVFMLVAAPLASYIPLAALAGVLAVVCWNMAERHAFATLLRSSREDALVLLTTFAFTVFRDLTMGILAGFTLSTLIFLHRMSQATSVTGLGARAPDDQADDINGDREPYDAILARRPDIAVYRISGAFFFGAAAVLGTVLERLIEHPRIFVLDFSAVPLLDSTGANMIGELVRKAGRNGVPVILTGVRPDLRKLLEDHQVRTPQVRFEPSIQRALATA